MDDVAVVGKQGWLIVGGMNERLDPIASRGPLSTLRDRSVRIWTGITMIRICGQHLRKGNAIRRIGETPLGSRSLSR
jgi:hypothetical protein